MALLSALVGIVGIVALAGGCYEPDVKSCTVTCASGDPCADGQACRGGFCVDDGAPACNANMATDAAGGSGSGATTAVMIQIAGHGHVVFGTDIVCDSEANLLGGGGTCTVPVPQHVPVHATAVPANGDMFMNWVGACNGITATCDFTPVEPALTLSPHFK